MEKLATMTPYATGATIKDMVNESLINAIRGGRDTINWADVVKAKQLKELGLAEDMTYVEHERHAIAVHEACHALAAHKVRDHMMIDIATIEGRANFLGVVASVRTEDRFTRWRSEYEDDIMVSLASLAGERMFFEGDNSSGVSGDLRSATSVATMMAGNWGMGKTISSHDVKRTFGIGGGLPPGEGQPEGEHPPRPSGLGDQIESSLVELYERVDQLLGEHRNQVLAIAHALETHLTITGDDVAAIIDGHEGPFIDGAGYYREGAAEKLENYHAAVLDYRRRGLEELPPLPEIDGVTGRIVGTVVPTAVAIEAVPPQPVDAASSED
jgi:ATP-dependent Zn protease